MRLEPVRLHIFACERRRVREDAEPPFLPALGSCLGAVQKIALAENAYDLAIGREYRKSAYVVLDHEGGDVADGGIRPHRDHLSRHDVSRFHWRFSVFAAAGRPIVRWLHSMWC